MLAAALEKASYEGQLEEVVVERTPWSEADDDEAALTLTLTLTLALTLAPTPTPTPTQTQTQTQTPTLTLTLPLPLTLLLPLTRYEGGQPRLEACDSDFMASCLLLRAFNAVGEERRQVRRLA